MRKRKARKFKKMKFDGAKIGRNDPCWCGSGKKYKQCHQAFDDKLRGYAAKGAKIPEHKMIKTKAQIDGIREAGKVNTEILDYISEFVVEGISTGEIDDRLAEYTAKLGGIPAPLNYEGYPKSVCTSIDEVVCHGIPDHDRILKSGDIINVDATTIYNGYYGDASRMFMIGEVSPEKKKLVEVTKECLDLGVKEVVPYGFLGDVGYVINHHAQENGFSVVREIGGHGVGLEFHEDPWVGHIGVRGTDYLLVPGMVFTIEPMVNMGRADVETDEIDGWTVRTRDRKPSAQWEYTLALTESGVEILSY